MRDKCPPNNISGKGNYLIDLFKFIAPNFNFVGKNYENLYKTSNNLAHFQELLFQNPRVLII